MKGLKQLPKREQNRIKRELAARDRKLAAFNKVRDAMIAQGLEVS